MPEHDNYCSVCGAKVLRNVTVSQAAPFSDVADSESARFSSFENLQQSVQEPVENLHTAKIEMCHGDHPPYPLFEGDAWTAWFVCSRCTGAVDLRDEYCKHCGVKLEPYDKLESGE